MITLIFSLNGLRVGRKWWKWEWLLGDGGGHDDDDDKNYIIIKTIIEGNSVHLL
jgi:hypothetical protein